MKTVFILNGPNLNLLGLREPEIYGAGTLGDIETAARAHAKGLGLAVAFRQTNVEGELVGWIQEARTKADAVILNAGAYTHTSIAIHDALKAFEGPIVELHLSNVHQREAFRHHSYVSLVAKAVLAGFGAHGYELALEGLARLIGPAS